MATIGQALPQPEQGWKRYDDKDSNIEYSSGWKDQPNANHYNGSCKSCNLDGSSVILKVNFVGDKVRIICYSDINKTSGLKIFIDGKEDSFNQYSESVIFKNLCYEKTNLNYSEHSLMIFTDKNILNKTITFDAIDIDINGELRPYNLITGIYLIQDQSNDLWTFKDDILTKSNNTLSEETFMNDGFRDYTVINNKTIDKIGLQGIDKGELGSGKYFEVGLIDDFKKVIDAPKTNLLYTGNVMPRMTSNSQDGVTVTDFKCFDGDLNTAWRGNEMIVDFEDKKNISKFSMISKSYILITITTYGSHDRENWNQLNSITWKFDDNSTPKVNEFINFTKYNHYKFTFQGRYGNRVEEFQLMELIIPIYYLIEYNSIVYTYDGSNFVLSKSNSIDEDNFKKNGFSNITEISEDLWSSTFENKDNIKVLMWMDKTINSQANLNVEVDSKPINQWLIDNKCKLLMWTDDIEKTEATMTYELENPYKPIDILKKNNNGICNILMSKN